MQGAGVSIVAGFAGIFFLDALFFTIGVTEVVLTHIFNAVGGAFGMIWSVVLLIFWKRDGGPAPIGEHEKPEQVPQLEASVADFRFASRKRF